MSEVIHWKEDHKDSFRCGKFARYNSKTTNIGSEATCKSCSECYKYDTGQIDEYKCGGSFSVYGKRKHHSHWTYKQEVDSLNKKITVLEKENEELKKYVEFFSLRLIEKYGENENIDYHHKARSFVNE